MKNPALPRLVISAPSTGQGKTTLSMGLMAALKKRNLKVQPYKVGPDYIDPAFHTAITGRSCVNLDGWLLAEEDIRNMFAHYSIDADISIIEGVMGLYDGYSDDPLTGSAAGISQLLDAPVLLVIQPDGMLGTAAAVVKGLFEFKPIKAAGVIINSPASDFHYESIKQAIEKHTGVKVLGKLPKAPDIQLKSRHLGLVQCCETEDMPKIMEKLAQLVEENIDLDALLTIARQTHPIEKAKPLVPTMPERAVIAVARDAGFSFYYHENLEYLKRLGARLVFFSPMADEALPQCDGIYIGGGYPEVFAEQLSANYQLRGEIRKKALQGLPVFAECGGYMYLNKAFKAKDGTLYEMLGIFSGTSYMTERLQHFGYAQVTAMKDNCLMAKGDTVRVHEFHKSAIELAGEDNCVRVQKDRKTRIEEWECGMQKGNVFGMYPHVYFPANPKLPERFIQQCIEYKRNLIEER